MRPRRDPPTAARPPTRSAGSPGAAGSRRSQPEAPGRTLPSLCREIDGQPFWSYRRLLGRHRLGEFEIIVDRVSPDPFAGPARVRLTVDRATAALPPALVANRRSRIAAEDFVARSASIALAEQAVASASAPPGTGRVFVERCGPCVLERSICHIDDARIELRVFVDLPASGRRVRGVQADRLFQETLVRLATSTLLFSARRVAEIERHVFLAEDHLHIQAELTRRGLVAFVADGSLLARASGTDEAPRRDGREMAFESPGSLAITIPLPHAGPVRGMGVPAGITLIIGGAFHGKSTLLDALSSGIHPHVEGDGRERVASLPEAVVVRAEDGRSVRRVDVSGFFGPLPSGEFPGDFSTEKASGSTSQAAAIVEALESGARVLLVDEDTSAMNFLIRDGRMQRLLPRPSEPVVPLLDRLRELYDRFAVSTVLVTGGSGDYIEAADTVLCLSEYRTVDATARAREIASQTRSTRLREDHPPMHPPARREILSSGAVSPSARFGLRGPRSIRIGEDTIEMTAIEQLQEAGQVRAVAALLRRAAQLAEGGMELAALLDELESILDAHGLDSLDPPAAYDLARPRRHEVAAALNRWRALPVRRPDR